MVDGETIGKGPDVAVEAAELLPQCEEGPGVADSRFEFSPVSDDPGIAHQSLHVGIIEAGYAFGIEIGEGSPKGLPFLQDGEPAQTRLHRLEH